MDFSLYWFMLPVAVLVATVAMMSGIAGAAMFMPIFLLAFPLLGEAYIIDNPTASIAAALLTSTFGFSSGFVGYYRRRLIDYQQCYPFLYLAIPVAIIGALLSPLFSPNGIRLAYGLLMLVLAYSLLRGEGTTATSPPSNRQPLVRLQDQAGKVYEYRHAKAKWGPTLLGGLLTGMLSTGIGEVVMPQLVKGARIPVPVAAATSVMIVILTFFFAACTHLVLLISKGGLSAVPWHLVAYTIPGVIIGGQIGPSLQGRVQRAVMVKSIAIVFLLIGIAMLWAVLPQLFQ
ncbi:MAG: sulfite exporter TauE/SafE family protein [Bacteroidota bacterium]